MTPLLPPFKTVRLNAPVGLYACEPGWNWKPRPLPDWDFWFVLDGAGLMNWNNLEYALHAGTCFVFGPNAQPQATQNPLRRLRVFAAHCELLDEHEQRVPIDALQVFQGALQARDASWFGLLMPRCARLWARNDELGREQCRLLVEQMLLQLWDESQREPLSPLDARLQELIEVVQREPGRAWTIAEMARRTHLSGSQMARRVRALSGRSPSRLVIEARLNRARQLLLETDMTLAQIAHALGYRDAFYFSRQWKQFNGNTPGSLRQRCANAAPTLRQRCANAAPTLRQRCANAAPTLN